MYLSKSFNCLISTRKDLLEYFLVFEIGNYKLKVLLYLLHRKILTLNFLPINFKIIFKNNSKPIIIDSWQSKITIFLSLPKDNIQMHSTVIHTIVFLD